MLVPGPLHGTRRDWSPSATSWRRTGSWRWRSTCADTAGPAGTTPERTARRTSRDVVAAVRLPAIAHPDVRSEPSGLPGPHWAPRWPSSPPAPRRRPLARPALAHPRLPRPADRGAAQARRRPRRPPRGEQRGRLRRPLGARAGANGSGKPRAATPGGGRATARRCWRRAPTWSARLWTGFRERCYDRRPVGLLLVATAAPRSIPASDIRHATDSLIFALSGIFFGLLLGWIIGSQQAGSGVPFAPPAQPQAQAPRLGGQSGTAPAVLDDARVRALTSAAEQRPQDAAVRVELGNAYFDAERFADAVKWYEEALKRRPEERQRQHRSRRLLLLHEPARPRDRAVRALADDRTASTSKTLLNMGIVRAFGKQDLKGAAEAWQQVIALAPDSTRAARPSRRSTR